LILQRQIFCSTGAAWAALVAVFTTMTTPV